MVDGLSRGRVPERVLQAETDAVSARTTFVLFARRMSHYRAPAAAWRGISRGHTQGRRRLRHRLLHGGARATVELRRRARTVAVGAGAARGRSLVSPPRRVAHDSLT